MTIKPNIYIDFPVKKALDNDGNMIIEGIASDSGLDLENEVVLASGWAESLPYLQQQGHLNFEHSNLLMGDIQEAKIVDAEWTEKKFGIRTMGKAIYLKGTIYKPNDEMPQEQQQALQIVRGTIAAGGRLGLSLEGTRAKSAPIEVNGQAAVQTSKAVAIGCAITSHAVNPRTFAVEARLAKSLSEALGTVGVDNVVNDEGDLPSVVVICKAFDEAEPVTPVTDIDNPVIVPDAGEADEKPLQKSIGAYFAEGINSILDIIKARRVKGHWRTLPNGKITYVTEHQDKRNAHENTPQHALFDDAGEPTPQAVVQRRLFDMDDAGDMVEKPTSKPRKAAAEKKPADAGDAGDGINQFPKSKVKGTNKKFIDVGEKIGGARKDIATARSDFEREKSANALAELEKYDPDMANRVVVKELLWEKPSIADYLWRNMDAAVAMYTRAAYDTIATKPLNNTPQARAAYRDAINYIRDQFESSTSHEEIDNRMSEMRDIYYKTRNYIQASDYTKTIINKPTDYELHMGLQIHAVGPRFYKWLNYQAKVKGMDRSEIQSWLMDNDYLIEGMIKRKPGPVRDYIKVTKEMVDAGNDSPELKTAMIKFWEDKPRAARPTTEEGREAKVVNKWKWTAPADYERLGDVKKIPVKNAESLIKLFGVRGVEFGNWMEDDASQVHVGRCVEALYDMADCLGLDIKDVSINGRLALAFGARGSGSALAHYEPGKKVINLTKLGGAGTIAHEWAHFLDNILAMTLGSQFDHITDDERLTDNPISQALWNVKNAIYNGHAKKMVIATEFKGKRIISAAMQKFGYGKPKIPEITQEQVQAEFDAIYKKYSYSFKGSPTLLRNTINYICKYTGAEGLYVPTDRSEFVVDAETRGTYWKKPTELFARAFETYVVDAMAEKGRGNNYLAHDVMYRQDGSPYPKGHERAAIKDAFDKLFAVIKQQGELKKALAILSKSAGFLTSTYETNHADMTGGDALRLSSLTPGKRLRKKRRKSRRGGKKSIVADDAVDVKE